MFVNELNGSCGQCSSRYNHDNCNKLLQLLQIITNNELLIAIKYFRPIHVR